MANTAGRRHALSNCYGQHRRPVARSHWLLWPTPQVYDRSILWQYDAYTNGYCAGGAGEPGCPAAPWRDYRGDPKTLEASVTVALVDFSWPTPQASGTL